MIKYDNTIPARLDPSPAQDAGHYQDLPVYIGPDTLEVLDGQKLSKVYTLGPDAGSGQVPELPFSNIVVGGDARLDIVIVVLPGISADVRIAVDIVGPHSEVNISGLYLCNADERLSIRTDLRHRVPECISTQLFNGVAGGSSRISFFGKIVVAPDAQKTEAYQTNRNLVVSSSAHAETKPQLEIYADDVKCSHGSTVGQLNDAALFYMQQRGIGQEEAKLLLQFAFVGEVLDKIALEPLRHRLHYLVERRFRGELEHCAGCKLCK